MEMTVNPTQALKIGTLIRSAARRVITIAEQYAAPALDLTIRVWVGKAFFLSGLTKIQSWDSTLALF